MNTTGVSYNVSSADFDLIDQEAESPDLFMRNGIFCTYYRFSSNPEVSLYCPKMIDLLD